jgi:hypothetical protein
MLNAGSVDTMLKEVLTEIPVPALAIHCHNTYGQALANIYRALQANDIGDVHRLWIYCTDLVAWDYCC